MRKKQRPYGRSKVSGKPFSKGHSVGEATQFKPGDSGNPGGRPKKTPYTEAHRKIAEFIGLGELNFLPTDTIAECVAKIMAREALKGKVNAAKEIADRTDGTPRQTVEISGQYGTSVQVEAKLTAGDLIGALRDIYGLSSGSDTPKPLAPLSLPAPMDRGSQPPEDSDKK